MCASAPLTSPAQAAAVPCPAGLLLINKPRGFSSHDIIAISRRILQTKTVGHSGTLDPMATGLLILLVGREATKRQSEFLKLAKTYTATLTLGTATDTWDADGSVVATQPVPPFSQAQVEQAAQRCSGRIRQPIPAYSAKRIGGQRMYSLARQGVEIEPRYNEVSVRWEQIVRVSPTEIQFTVEGSCGTYVRSLGQLLARELGTIGHLTRLQREKIGPYELTNAFDGNLLKTSATATLRARIIPL